VTDEEVRRPIFSSCLASHFFDRQQNAMASGTRGTSSGDARAGRVNCTRSQSTSRTQTLWMIAWRRVSQLNLCVRICVTSSVPPSDDRHHCSSPSSLSPHLTLLRLRKNPFHREMTCSELGPVLQALQSPCLEELCPQLWPDDNEPLRG
jgi:hypothetical protein